MTNRGYISDGYTEQGYVQALPGVHEAVAFEYRPLTTLQRADVYRGLRSDSDEAMILMRESAALAEHVTQWDVRSDTVVPVQPEEFLRLKRPLYDRMRDIVFGDAASDSQQEDAEKNSPPE